MKRLLRTLLYLLASAFVVSLFFRRADIPIEQIREKYSYPDSRFIRLDGMDVHYRITGDSGAFIVLLHGTGSSLHTWEGWTQELSMHYRVVSFDLPGFGLTGPEPAGIYSRGRYLRFIDDMLVKLDIDSCHMAGNSFGGYMAWSYAAQHPEKVRKLALLNASGYPQDHRSAPIGFRMQRVKWLKPLLTRITPEFLIRKSVKDVYYDDSKVTDELVQRYYDLLLREGNRGGLMGKSAQITYGHANEIRLVRCPTLIMWGDSDKLVNAEAASRFHADIPDSELLIYGNMGHVPMEEIPEISARDLIAFLQK